MISTRQIKQKSHGVVTSNSLIKNKLNGSIVLCISAKHNKVKGFEISENDGFEPVEGFITQYELYNYPIVLKNSPINNHINNCLFSIDEEIVLVTYIDLFNEVAKCVVLNSEKSEIMSIKTLNVRDLKWYIGAIVLQNHETTVADIPMVGNSPVVNKTRRKPEVSPRKTKEKTTYVRKVELENRIIQ